MHKGERNKMNIKPAIKYNLNNFRKSLSIYYLVIVLFYIFSLIMGVVVEGQSTMNGTDIIAGGFLFIVGLGSFKDEFHMLIQNGVSRKTTFVAYIMNLGIAAALMTVIELILEAVFSGITSITGIDNVRFGLMFESIYAGRYAGTGVFLRTVETFLWVAALYLALGMLGFFITNLYYRMNKTLKIIVSVGVPSIIFIGFPIVNNFMGNKLVEAGGRLVLFILGYPEGGSPYSSDATPYHMILFCLALFVICGGLAWLLMRRAVTKKL